MNLMNKVKDHFKQKEDQETNEKGTLLHHTFIINITFLGVHKDEIKIVLGNYKNCTCVFFFLTAESSL